MRTNRVELRPKSLFDTSTNKAGALSGKPCLIGTPSRRINTLHMGKACDLIERLYGNATPRIPKWHIHKAFVLWQDHVNFGSLPQYLVLPTVVTVALTGGMLWYYYTLWSTPYKYCKRQLRKCNFNAYSTTVRRWCKIVKSRSMQSWQKRSKVSTGIADVRRTVKFAAFVILFTFAALFR